MSRLKKIICTDHGFQISFKKNISSCDRSRVFNLLEYQEYRSKYIMSEKEWPPIRNYIYLSCKYRLSRGRKSVNQYGVSACRE